MSAARSEALASRRRACFRGFLLAAALTTARPSRAADPFMPPATGEAPPPGVAVEAPYDPAAHGGYSEAAWLRTTRGMERRSVGMMVTGASFIALGASMMAAGAIVGLDADHCHPTQVTLPDGGQRSVCGAMAGRTTGTVVAIAGMIGLGLGIPLTVLGASDVPPAVVGGRSPRNWRATLKVGLRQAAFALKF